MDINILSNYRNRQVIINEYREEDFLENRTGFQFETIVVTENSILFQGKNHNDFILKLEKISCFFANDDFQNYYILKNDSHRIEIYFP